MSSYLRYPLVLGLVAMLSGLALYGTYSGTKAAAARQAEAARAQALSAIFLEGFARTEEVRSPAGRLLYTRVWQDEDAAQPAWFAVEGEGVGYNTSVPIRLLVGFANPAASEVEGYLLVGWSVTRSEETPGLGEKIKEQAPPYTWAGKLTGQDPPPGRDRRTAFQRQFADPANGVAYTATELALKADGGSLDGISGATITSRAVIEAIQDAEQNLRAARTDTP